MNEVNDSNAAEARNVSWRHYCDHCEEQGIEPTMEGFEQERIARQPKPELLAALAAKQADKPADHFTRTRTRPTQSKHWLFGRGAAGVEFGKAMQGTDADTFAWHVAAAAHRAGFKQIDFGKLRSRILAAIGEAQ